MKIDTAALEKPLREFVAEAIRRSNARAAEGDSRAFPLEVRAGRGGPYILWVSAVPLIESVKPHGGIQ